MRVGIYVRVSTDDQRDNGYSIDSQIRMLKEHAERNNYKNIAQEIVIASTEFVLPTNSNIGINP